MSDEAQNRAKINKTQTDAEMAADAAKIAADDAKDAVDEAGNAIKDYWAARDKEIAAAYRAAEAKRRGNK